MTTTPIRPVTIEDVPEFDHAERDILGYIEQGLEEATSEVGIPELQQALHEVENHPAVLAFEEEVVEQAAAEIAPQVAQMMREAIRKRLPWTWEPARTHHDKPPVIDPQ